MRVAHEVRKFPVEEQCEYLLGREIMLGTSCELIHSRPNVGLYHGQTTILPFPE